jgi:hypothetical protein
LLKLVNILTTVKKLGMQTSVHVFHLKPIFWVVAVTDYCCLIMPVKKGMPWRRGTVVITSA